MLQVPHGESMQEREQSQNGVREHYQRTMLEIHGAFAAGASGGETIAARARAVDELVRGLWYEIVQENPGALESGIALVPIGGYGRSQLFPCSDVDLLILLDSK